MSWTLKGHKKILLKFFGGRDQQASDLLIQLQPLNIWLLLSCGNLKTEIDLLAREKIKVWWSTNESLCWLR